jgi:hypothetical protein
MMLTKLQRNRLYEAIADSGIDPGECTLEVNRKGAVIKHDSGSTFDFSDSFTGEKYKCTAKVTDGSDKSFSIAHELGILLSAVREWAREIKETTEAVDYWAEMLLNRELIDDIQDRDSGNTPFTLDEQKQIADQFQEIRKQLRQQFELTNEQIEQIDARLDEAVEASTRMGRKDWRLLFGGTILNLIVTDTLTPGVAGHIFTMVMHGLIHLFTGAGGPPQILA